MYLPTTVSASKRRKLEDAGASLVLYGEDTVDTEMEARKKAMERGLPYISPYNDIQVRQAHRINFLQALVDVFSESQCTQDVYPRSCFCKCGPSLAKLSAALGCR